MKFKQYIFLLFIIPAFSVWAQEIPGSAPIISARIEEVEDLIQFSGVEEKLKPFMPEWLEIKTELINLKGNFNHTPPEIEERLNRLYSRIYPILEKRMKSMDQTIDDKMNKLLVINHISFLGRHDLVLHQLTPVAGRYWGFRPMAGIHHLVIHHTVSDSVPQIYKLHVHSGYLDNKGAPYISYHYLILQNGTVIKLNYLSERVWQAKSANQSSIGIALLGNHDIKDLTLEQKRSLGLVVKVLRENLHVTAIKGHQQIDAKNDKTLCPGKYGMDVVKGLQF
ncbi:N-acetylmuramoyl-L-alanine amidase [bacterium]|nr:N-acetylmuramoyl-L-alanine amidase [bacterium]